MTEHRQIARQASNYLLPTLLVLIVAGCAGQRELINRSEAEPRLQAHPASGQENAAPPARPTPQNTESQRISPSATVRAGYEAPTPADEFPVLMAEPVAAPPPDCGEMLPIDLPNALRLAGGSNPQIALAAERVSEAEARYVRSKAAWLPSLNLGLGYNKHDGRLQDTQGRVIDGSRSSLFVGGGAGLGSSPLTGGTNGPARFFVDLSLADAIFEPLARRQTVRATAANRSAVFNDVLLDAALAWLDLTHAQGRGAISRETIGNTEELLRITDAQRRAGAGLAADVERVKAELATRRRDLLDAEEQAGVASAELAQILQLDPSVQLVSVDEAPLPIDLVPLEFPLPDLIQRATFARPEVARAGAQIDETYARVNQERWRPLVPNLHVGTSYGGFGGAPGSEIRSFSDRVDIDALAVWQLQNLGIGNRQARWETASRNRQAQIARRDTVTTVAAEVAAAYRAAVARREQIEVAKGRVEAAARALPLNFTGIRGGELRAIEAQQAITALDAARRELLQAIIRYNEAQFRLLRAIGVPPNCAPLPGGETSMLPSLAPLDR